MKKIYFVLVLFLALALVVGCTAKKAEGKKLKAGFVYVGPIGDAGWTKSHDEGRLGMETLEFMEPSAYVESVPEGADATRVITELVESGCNIIFTTSFGYMDPTMEVAAKYPDVTFLHATGYKKAENFTNYMGRMYQGKYLSGIVAGKMTETNKIGYVAPFPIPEVVRLINAFTIGAKSVNPDVTVQVLWTNSWFDPVHEKEAANTMIADGCDLITQGADSAGPQEAAEAAGVYSIGYDSDMSIFAPTAHLTAPIWDWAIYYKYVANKIHDGTWTNEPIWWDMSTGLVKLAPYNDRVPQEIRDYVAAEKAKMLENDMIFAGPLKNNAGKLMVKEGEKLTDSEMLSIQWFVEGVKGKIPEATK